MNRKISIIVASIVGLACLAFLGYLMTLHTQAVKQGISGKAIEYTGNCMPPTPCPGSPVSVQLNIYKAKSLSQTGGELIASVYTNQSDGSYSVSLPVGKYSVIPIQNGRERCDTEDSDGIACAVEVTTGHITEYNPTIDNAVW